MVCSEGFGCFQLSSLEPVSSETRSDEVYCPSEKPCSRKDNEFPLRLGSLASEHSKVKGEEPSFSSEFPSDSRWKPGSSKTLSSSRVAAAVSPIKTKIRTRGLRGLQSPSTVCVHGAGRRRHTLDLGDSLYSPATTGSASSSVCKIPTGRPSANLDAVSGERSKYSCSPCSSRPDPESGLRPDAGLRRQGQVEPGIRPDTGMRRQGQVRSLFQDLASLQPAAFSVANRRRIEDLFNVSPKSCQCNRSGSLCPSSSQNVPCLPPIPRNVPAKDRFSPTSPHNFNSPSLKVRGSSPPQGERSPSFSHSQQIQLPALPKLSQSHSLPSLKSPKAADVPQSCSWSKSIRNCGNEAEKVREELTKLVTLAKGRNLKDPIISRCNAMPV